MPTAMTATLDELLRSGGMPITPQTTTASLNDLLATGGQPIFDHPDAAPANIATASAPLPEPADLSPSQHVLNTPDFQLRAENNEYFAGRVADAFPYDPRLSPDERNQIHYEIVNSRLTGTPADPQMTQNALLGMHPDVKQAKLMGLVKATVDRANSQRQFEPSREQVDANASERQQIEAELRRLDTPGATGRDDPTRPLLDTKQGKRLKSRLDALSPKLVPAGNWTPDSGFRLVDASELEKTEQAIAARNGESANPLPDRLRKLQGKLDQPYLSYEDVLPSDQPGKVWVRNGYVRNLLDQYTDPKASPFPAGATVEQIAAQRQQVGSAFPKGLLTPQEARHYARRDAQRLQVPEAELPWYQDFFHALPAQAWLHGERAVGGLTQLAGDVVQGLNPDIPLWQQQRGGPNAMSQLAQGARQLGQDIVADAESDLRRYAPSPSAQGSGAYGQTYKLAAGAPILAASAATGGIAPMVVEVAGNAYATTYQTLKSQGASEEHARAGAVADAAVDALANAALMSLLPTFMHGEEAAAQPLIRRAVQRVVQGMAMMGGANAVSQEAQQVITGKPFDPREFADSLLQGGLFETVMGAIHRLPELSQVFSRSPRPEAAPEQLGFLRRASFPEAPQMLEGRDTPPKPAMGQNVRLRWTDANGEALEGFPVGARGGMVAVRGDDGSLHEVPADRLQRVGEPSLPARPYSPQFRHADDADMAAAYERSAQARDAAAEPREPVAEPPGGIDTLVRRQILADRYGPEGRTRPVPEQPAEPLVAPATPSPRPAAVTKDGVPMFASQAEAQAFADDNNRRTTTENVVVKPFLGGAGWYVEPEHGGLGYETEPQRPRPNLKDLREAAVARGVDPKASPRKLVQALAQTATEQDTPSTSTTQSPAPSQEQSPAPSPSPRAARGFSREALRGKLIDHLEQMSEDTAHEEKMAEEAGGTTSSFTFYKRLPEEVKNFLSAHPEAKGVFRVVDTPDGAGGEDAMHSMGDEYWRVAQRFGNNKLEAALDLARKDPSPEIQFLAALHDNLPPKAEKMPQQTIAQEKLRAGDAFEINGHRFQVVEDDNGMRILKDGRDYPELPLDFVDRLPVDKGTLTHAEPAKPVETVTAPNPEPAYFDADQAGVSKPQTGIFGQPEFLPATGSQQGAFFDTSKPPEPERIGSKNATDPRHTPGMFAMSALGEEAPRSKARPERTIAPAEKGPKTRNAGIGHELFGPQSVVGQDLQPNIVKGVKWLANMKDWLQRMFAPDTRSPEARQVHNALRQMGSEFDRKMDQIREQFRAARNLLERRPFEKNIQTVDDLEHGRDPGDPMLRKWAQIRKTIYGSLVSRVHAIDPNAMQHLIENYFPHVWKDPTKAGEWLATLFGKGGKMEGGKSFLKKRSIPTTLDGIRAGLQPVSDNPVDLDLIKMAEMQKFILAHEFLKEMKARGILRYIPVGGEVPEGYSAPNDKLFHVYGPPTVEVKEAFDKLQREALIDFAEKLGVSHERVVKMRGGTWGLSAVGSPSIKTRFGGPNDVIAHEIGHQLGEKYGLFKALVGGQPEKTGRVGARDDVRPSQRVTPGQILKEWRALAALRHEGMEPSESAKAYVQSKEEKEAVVVQAYVYAPDRFREVAPNLWLRFNDFLNAHPELAELRDIRPSLVLGTDTAQMYVPGIRELGRYYAPSTVTYLLNQHFAPGIRNHPLYRLFMSGNNVINMATLGFSAFHLGMEAVGDAVGKGALALNHAARGEWSDAAFEAAMTGGGLPTSFVPQILKGSKVLQEWLEPGSQGEEMGQVMQILVAGGARAKQDPIYTTRFTAGMMKSLRLAMDAAPALAEGNIARAMGRASNLAGAAAKLGPALIEQQARPIFEYIVPRLKLAAMFDLARLELERLGPDATIEQMREVGRRIVDTVDNRYGQMIYDNIAMNKAMKDLMMVTVGRPGWQLGTVRELVGGAKDMVVNVARLAAQTIPPLGRRVGKPELTYRTAYLLALPMVVGMAGAMYNYVCTGEWPKEVKDYFMPRTGEMGPDGKPVRVMLPSYAKDGYHILTGPLKWSASKVAPAVRATFDLVTNSDFYNRKIVDTSGQSGVVAKGAKATRDVAAFGLGQLKPYSVQNWQKLDEQGVPFSQRMPAFVGVSPAPMSMTRSSAEELAAELAGEQAPRGAMSQAQAAKADLEMRLVKQLRQGDRKALKDALETRQLTRDDALDLIHRSQEPPLVYRVKKLEPEAAIRVWDVATDQEKKLIFPILVRKIHDARLTASQKAMLLKRIASR